MVANLLLTLTGYVGFYYMAVAAILGVYWLYIACAGYRASDSRHWAKQLFVFSIVIVIVLNIMMSIDFMT